MAESLFASLLHTLARGNISEIASSLGESEQGVFRGMESSIASVLGVMASKAHDPDALRKTLDLVPDNSGEVSWAKLSAGLSGTASPWIGRGKQMLSTLFGAGDSAVAGAVGRESGVTTGTATTLLAMAAPMVIRFLNRRVYDEGLSMSGLGAMLQRESVTIRSALPAGLSDLLWPRAAAATASYPVIAQSVKQEKSSSGWLGALCLATLALGCFWVFSHARKPMAGPGVAVTGEANRMADEGTRLGDFVRRRLPNGTYLNVPPNGVESGLLGVLEGTNAAGQPMWLDFDRLTFDSDSSTVRPDSSEQLDNITAILKAYPNVRVTIAGFTDDVGSAERNIELSHARANNVKAQLVSRGISPERLTTLGYGEQSASADNSSAAGRARNRRVCLQVTKR